MAARMADGDHDAVRAWLTQQKRPALTDAFLEDGYDTLEAVAGMTWDDDLQSIAGMKKGFKGPLTGAIKILGEVSGDPASECPMRYYTSDTRTHVHVVCV